MTDKHDKKDKNDLKDKLTGIETTGHEWDGIKELNRPAPFWWLLVLYICIIFSIYYWIVYPAWPTPSGHTKGSAGWTSHKKLEKEQAEIAARKAKYMKQSDSISLHDILDDQKLYNFFLAGGEYRFKDNCATCHGTGATGQGTYPNLNDDDWLWGGSIDEIYTTIKYGIRSEHENTRFSAMPAFGDSEILNSAEINIVADYVISGMKTKAGAEIFADNCAACHGEKGTGNREFGAPNLVDAIWLYGGDKESVIYTIAHARNSTMPSWSDRLSEESIRMLAVYVHSLGGGE